jgi:hypothetical protein
MGAPERLEQLLVETLLDRFERAAVRGTIGL